MITHLIEIKREPENNRRQHNKHMPPWTWQTAVNNVLGINSKHEFNMYVNKCRYKQGDYLGEKDGGWPLQEHNVWKVIYMQECHWLVQWTEEGTPRILCCRNAKREERWFSPDEVFGITNPPFTVD